MTHRKRRIAADEAHSWARNLRLRNPYAKLVLCMLSLYVDGAGTCFVGIDALAEDTELSADTVRKRLAWLEQVGAVARFPQWIDASGRRNGEGRGKRTSDEIRLLMDADIDAIEARACGDDVPADGEGAAEISPRPQQGLNPAQGSIGPRLALGQPSHCSEGQDSSEPEQEDSPPKPSLAPVEASEADQQREEPDRVPFHRFQVSYPIPILKPQEARTLWAGMTDDEREQAIEGARGYARFLEREKRRAMDAHRWLRERLWTQFAGQAAGAGGRVFVAEGSEAWVAWQVAYQLRGYRELPLFLLSVQDGQRGATVSSEYPALGRGLPAFDRLTWTFVPQGDNRWWAWRERLVAAFGEGVRFLTRGKADGVDCDGAWFPSDWPPPKHAGGSATGPPAAALTEDDVDALARAG